MKVQTLTHSAPVFIVGCARSGTTLLQSLLGSHSEIASFPESKFFEHLVWLPEARSRRYALGLASRQLRSTLESFLDEVGHPEFKRKLPRLPFIKAYVRSFRNILAELTQLQGKTIWLEKTPEHLRRLKYIELYMPEAKVIHIVRNGADVVASLYDLAQRHPDHWGRTFRSLDICIQWWANDIAITHAYLHKPNHTLVRYEQLVDNPTSEIKRLCQFIGVPFEPQMMANYRNNSSQFVRSRETWKASTQQDIQNTNSQKFLSVFTPEQQTYISRAVDKIELPTLTAQTTLQTSA